MTTGVVGCSIADHFRSGLVVDALQMAIGRRQLPKDQTVANSDHGSDTRRGRSAGDCGVLDLLGSMGSHSTTSRRELLRTLQLELLDEHWWEGRQHVALAIFDWIGTWYNPKRRHSYCQMLSPVDREAVIDAVKTAA